MRPVIELDLPLVLDPAGPLQRQLVTGLRRAVLTGALPAGSRLPASRTLAGRLGVARSTVVGAFEQLLGEGVLEARHGSGTFVAVGATQARPGTPVPEAGAAPRAAGGIDLRPGRPDATRLADAAWRRAWREAADAVPDDEPPPAGLPALRAAIAAHIAAARGLSVDPGRVLITGGTREAIGLLASTLPIRRIAVEDPGYPAGRRVLAASGATAVPIPVDGEGLVVEALPSDLDAVLVTPNHQYPLGGTMPLGRRAALLDWARRTGALVLEDDYDGEFRYDVLPLPALAALDPDTVVHVGTFAKSVSPWVRVGYAVVPVPLAEPLIAARQDLGRLVDGVTQSALAAYVASGGLARHIARSRRDHAHRRARLLQLLAAHPGLTPRGSSAGLHLVVELPDGSRAADVVAAATDRGVHVADLEGYRLRSRGPAAVVLGYGAARLQDLEVGVAALAAAVTATSRPTSA